MRSIGASRLRFVGVAVVVVALVALAAARAQAGSMYMHSARNGTFVGGRLTLHGVGRNVTWTTTGGRAGVAPITLAQKRLFVRNTQARGVLHIAGQRGGQEFTFRLSGPRYSAARSTVSYRAAPLTKVAVAARAAAAVPRRFGAASLSVLPTSSRGSGLLGSAPHPALGSGDNGGNDCENAIWNDTSSRTSQGNPIQLVSSQQWDTDDWLSPPRTDLIFFNDAADVISEGGLWRGCEDTTVWHFVPACIVGQGCGPSGTFTVSIEWDWSWVAPRYTCTSSNPQYTCKDGTTPGGVINWALVPA